MAPGADSELGASPTAGGVLPWGAEDPPLRESVGTWIVFPAKMRVSVMPLAAWMRATEVL